MNQAHINRIAAFPIVLVIGDFEHETRDARFGLLAWQRICKTYQRLSESYVLEDLRLIPAPFDGTPNAAIALDKLHTIYSALESPFVREDNPWPIPVPISHGTRQQAAQTIFCHRLYEYLSLFDVVGVIACGPANQTTELLRHLDDLRVPVFATVDSTVGNSTPKRYNVRHLMPSNELQAQAIAARIWSLYEQHQASACPVNLFAYPRDDEYVKDLARAIHGQFRNSDHLAGAEHNLYPRNVALPEAVEANEAKGTVICVGYVDALQQLLDQNRTGKFLVISDGCFRLRAIREVGKYATEHEQSIFFWAHAVRQPEIYAEDAYIALGHVWHAESQLRRPRDRMRSIATKTVQELADIGEGESYEFDGFSNRRGGYVVERLTEKVRARWSSRLSIQDEANAENLERPALPGGTDAGR